MFKKGTEVVWNWGAHKVKGKIAKIFKKPITEKEDGGKSA